MKIPEPEVLRPGLLVLHGNRLELLAEAVFSWLGAHPLAPLEEENFLVQSNGMAEWLKMSLASSQGVCAATRVELPARFIWRTYRAVLGRNAVPSRSTLDDLPMTWRLMRLLPALIGRPGFSPIAAFLEGGDAGRRLQLAQRLADLFDQYQVYRSDWLQDWAEGRDVLHSDGKKIAVPADQSWQPALWRALLSSLPEGDESASRSVLHRRFCETLGQGGDWPRLPRRVVLFGSTHIPHQTLEAICALSAHSQVLMAVPNPCRYHWADIIEGRELLRATRRRHAFRGDRELNAVPMQDMNAHGHPLLAAWGRQSRDFVRQLDVFDDAQQARARFDVPRVDLFDEGPGATLLEQVQARIRDLVPLAEHPEPELAATDRSIVFHIAHSAQREVEILHDQLLHLLAHPGYRSKLAPRDVVVMVPDIDAYAPAIRSVFGQFPRGHARYIPWGITDQNDRGRHPLLVALEWLLRAPRQRYTYSELRDLLDVPAIAKRFGIPVEDLPAVVAWIEGAGIRWGLDASQRESLGLEACGDANSWQFGLRRMLLGYATGDLDGGHAGIEPYAEVAGLEAGLAGALAEFLHVLTAWWRDAAEARTPQAWALRLRTLVTSMFVATDDVDRALLVALDDALGAWLDACQSATFDETVEIAVVREAWLEGVDEPSVSRRFRAGGVTFCTLLPLRAIPFDVVCLLGMNDGDYPRRSARSDFDLMALAGQARPGDRSRRDDDRQLMLDALLSARRVLYLSWAGRSLRDNQEQPPSVLVSQLRDYLAAGWTPGVVRERTIEHPMQPFSRRYFEPRPAAAAADDLLTYAAEWRAAHVEAVASEEGRHVEASETASPLTVRRVASFLRNPVREFFRHRLQVAFDEMDAAAEDDEAFVTGGLDRWKLLDEVIHGVRRQLDVEPDAGAPEALPLEDLVAAQLDRLQRAARFPMAGPGRLVRDELAAVLVPMIDMWQKTLAKHPRARDKLALRMAHPTIAGLAFDDWLVGLSGSGGIGEDAVWIDLLASKIADAKIEKPRPDKLLVAWVRCLASAACGSPAGGVLIGADAVIEVSAPARDDARETLLSIMQACHAGLRGDAPVPAAVRTGLAWLEDETRAARVFDSDDYGRMGEGAEACLARLYPDFAALSASADFAPATKLLYAPFAHWLVGHVTVTALDNPAASKMNGDD